MTDDPCDNRSIVTFEGQTFVMVGNIGHLISDVNDDPCDDWANHIKRRWVPMLDKRTRAERRAFPHVATVTFDPPEHWTLGRYRERMTELRNLQPPAPLTVCAKCQRPTIAGCACVYCNG